MSVQPCVTSRHVDLMVSKPYVSQGIELNNLKLCLLQATLFIVTHAAELMQLAVCITKMHWCSNCSDDELP